MHDDHDDTKPTHGEMVGWLTQYVTCEWFATCKEPSVATVEHPTIGDVEICQVHLDWLTEDMHDGQVNPTKMVPPIAARHHRRIAHLMED